MTDQDNLRDRIETILDRFTGESWEHHHRDAAQAIIDDLRLETYDFTRHDGHTTTHVHGWMERKQ